MAIEGIGTDWTFLNSATVAGKQYCAVTLGTTGQVSVSGANENAVGILQDDDAGANTGRACQVRLWGISKAVAGGSFNAGVDLETTTAGKLIESVTAGHFVVGKALEASGADGDIVTVLVQRGGLKSA